MFNCAFQGITGYKLSNKDVFQSLKICLILPNSADRDEMPNCVVFHIGVPCLLKYPIEF